MILYGIPMPPSHNAAYAAMGIRGTAGKCFGKIRPTRVLEQYSEWFAAWALHNRARLAEVQRFVKDEILGRGYFIGIESVFYFHRASIFTLKGAPKMIDAANRLKVLHDCLSEALDVDDSLFWEGTFKKAESHRDDPFCVVRLYPVEHTRKGADATKERL